MFNLRNPPSNSKARQFFRVVSNPTSTISTLDIFCEAAEMMKRLFSTSACFYRIDPAYIAGPNMMRKMLRRQQKEIEIYKQRQLQNQKPSLPKIKPYKVRFEDTNKSKAFNTLFLQNIQLVLHSPNFNHLFTNTGLKIIKVFK